MAKSAGHVSIESNIDECTAQMDAAIKRALEIIGGKAESYAKAACPVDTGNLRNSITHKSEGYTEMIGTSVYYAPYVELGHHQQPGRFVPKIKKRLVRSWVPGKPFLGPAVEEHVGEWLDVLEGEMKKG